MLDKHGISVLLAAIWEGHTDCVKTLLKHVSLLTTFYIYNKYFHGSIIIAYDM